MDIIFEGIKEALKLIFSTDKQVYQILFLTIRVSETAVAISMFLGMPAGILVGLNRFAGKKLVVA
ncbi:MAG: hypothetical protein R6U35_00905 [Candidatus Humimicrobiaceae bacterium]